MKIKLLAGALVATGFIANPGHGTGQMWHGHWQEGHG